MASNPGTVDPSSILYFRVAEGEEIQVGQPGWDVLTVPVGTVVEVCLAGSSVGLGTEEWFALLAREVSERDASGITLSGEVLGCENSERLAEVVGCLTGGHLHLCQEDPCSGIEEEKVIHATRVRLWTVVNFDCTYLSKSGKAALKKAITTYRKSLEAPPGSKKAPKGNPKRASRAKAADGRRARKQPSEADCVSLLSDEDADGEGDNTSSAGQRAHLRQLLRRTRERISGSGGATGPRAGEALAGGPVPSVSPHAAAESRLVAGTALNPGRLTPLALDLSGATKGAEEKRLRKSLSRGDASAVLLAQAVQSNQLQAAQARKEKKESSAERSFRKLAELLGGKKKKKKRRERRMMERLTSGVKPDPDGGDSGSSSSSSSSSRSRRRRKRGDSSEDSDLSCEAPLRRKAAREPGSVMEMLIKHAQQQMDQGALLESSGAAAGLTSGVRISTFFALMIRPFHSNNSPLVRELFALGQAIDLLRAGKLPETADALASRFIAVHTALGDGNWQVASQLEMYPLEPTTSATTSTMLQAQKHRRLLQRSQGYTGGQWYASPTGRGKGGGGWNEKGRKGDAPKGRGKGKGKGQNKSGQPAQKGEVNPWKEMQEEPGKK